MIDYTARSTYISHYFYQPQFYQKTLIIDATHIVDEELNKAYKWAKSLHPILDLYFQEQIEQHNKQIALESEHQNLLIKSKNR